MLDATAAHVARRVRASGRPLVWARLGGGCAGGCAFRELALRCGVHTADPLAAAREILASMEGAVLLVMEGAATGWGHAVAEEMTRLVATQAVQAAQAARVLVLVCSEGAPTPWAPTIALRGSIGREELHLWWEALAGEAQRQLGARFDRLDALDGWWTSAVAVEPGAPRPAPELRPTAAKLLTRLTLAQMPWHAAQLGNLLPTGIAVAACAEARDELLSLGLVEVDARGWVIPIAPPMAPANPARPDDTLAAAEALEKLSAEPWAWLRASELLAGLGLIDRAEDVALRALAWVTDPAARSDLWRRWTRALEGLPREASGACLLRAAQLAMQVGDVDRSFELARASVAREGEVFEPLLTLGRAMMARGDLTTAAIVLGKALERAQMPAERARALVQLADTHYKAGDFATARRAAEAGLADAGDLEARLDARNVLGKLLLADASWAEAERHFAADGWDAACGNDLHRELRARMNRAVALLSGGSDDEARAMLLSVLDDGQRAGESRATAFALSNLAVIATQRTDYAEALRLSEQAIDVSRQVGDRVGLANCIANLAELRLRVGLVAEAEQALAFGRKVCSAGLPGTWAPHFALVMAQIRLAQGRSEEARTEVTKAIASASGSNHGAKRSECHAMAARVALDEGDVTRAAQALDRARGDQNPPALLAELALLDAELARATGEPFGELSLLALDRARTANDDERAREAYVLLHHAAVLGSDRRAARAHLTSACALRDQLADALPPELRAKFLARPTIAALCRAQAAFVPEDRDSSRGERGPLSGPVSGPASSMEGDLAARPSSLRASAPASRDGVMPAAQRMAGRTPAVVSLLSQIHKVGPTDATVLIFGESGTGKELVAEALHELSPRKSGPLVKVNCAALVETLLLSELFGHEKGSFTGAAARRRGRFELAEGGTLFLDEIGDISPRTQVALLRVLQDRTFERVGGVTPLRANCRIVCATHRDLRAMVARGEFREDLYYRLRQVVLEVAPLRQRIGDLPLIAAEILTRIARERGNVPKRLSDDATAALSTYAWPGNVRELENALRAAALFAEGNVIELADITANVDDLRGLAAAAPLAEPSAGAASLRGGDTAIPSAPPSSDPRPSDPGRTPVEAAYAHVRAGVSLSDMKREIERECIARALTESNGNITRAATLLGMKRPRLSQLVKQYGFGGCSED
ncbi:sigma 54-interacting transcriptional regulator [Chondromyces apiculatus]|uniref:sigma 54-interacting transcriptional regulator n=1 Tax=Chondromyces apiculatus TaxID=51 RepID=UPI0012DE2592|nr:sigma 54-interacting transcriptional regulator [Chondromyces apiculatus]